MKKFTIIFYCLFFSLIGNICAQEQNQTSISSQSQESHQASVDSPLHEFPDDLDSFFKRHENEENFRSKFANMLAILGLLIAFMLLASWSIKRMMKTRVSEINTASSIKILETRYLSPKATLYLLDVMGKGILISESTAGVNQIASIPLEDLKEQKEDTPYVEK